MAIYNYTKTPVSVGTLRDEILAESGIITTLTNINYKGSNSSLDVFFATTLSGGEITLLNDLVATHSGVHPLTPAELPTTGVSADYLILSDGSDGSVWLSKESVVSGAGHNVLAGLSNDDHLQYVPTDGSRGFTSTVSGVDPVNDGDLVTKGYVDVLVSGSSSAYLNWSENPTHNGDVDVVGWHEQIGTGVTLDNSVFTVGDDLHHAHLVLDVTDATDAPFTVTVSGLVVDESTGIYSTSTEDITISGVGYYQTSVSFIDAPRLFIVEPSKSCTCDVYNTTYWDNNNEDFIVEGCRFEWNPDSVTWNIHVQIYKIDHSGKAVLIDSIDFANTDTIERAHSDHSGKYKRTDYNTFARGSNDEGLVIKVDQFGINYFNLFLHYVSL